jgi:patatin-like phospholipase/acyl hydrolase
MPFRILSLDGGGIRGVVAATMLAEVEKLIDKPLNQYFNLIAGTSTGAILASAIAIGKRSQEIIELYKQKGSLIFPYKSRLSPQRLGLVIQYGLSAPKYSDAGLIQVMKETFENVKLWDVKAPLLLITSYDTISREPIFFKNWRQDKAYGNVPLWEACVCSASAPTFFPAHRLTKKAEGIAQKATARTITLAEDASSIEDEYKYMQIVISSGKGSGQTRTIAEYDGANRTAQLDSSWNEIPDNTSVYSLSGIYSAIDGGVAANNPSSCAIAEALRLNYPLEKISVLSVGTGDRTDVISLEKAQEWGAVQWAVPVIGVLFDGSSDVHDYVSKQVLDNRLLRLQFKLDRQLTGKPLSDELDDVNRDNIENLIEASKVYINQPKVQARLRRFLQL